jgi:phosphoglycerol transferase
MRSPLSPSLARSAWPLFVVLATVLLWTGYTSRWDLTAWRMPDDFGGDPCEIFARVRIAMDDPLQPLVGFTHIARLGAPFAADWSVYPVGDGPTFALAGLLARAIGPFASLNVLGCALLAAAALSFHLCARRLGWRPEWAACGALLFAFSNYHLRWFITLSFTQTWTLPPLLLLCASAARPAPPAPGSRKLLGLGAALGVWLGFGNPYFVFFAGCIVLGTAGLGRLRRAPWRRLAPLAAFLGAMGFAVLLAHWAFFAAKLTGTPGTEQFDRGYTGAELYALKPLDLVIPPADHRSRLFRDIGQVYSAFSALKGEFFYNYLGLVGIGGLVLLAFAGLRAVARRDSRRRVPDAVHGVLWCSLIATVGGGTAALALCGVDWFRASNRIGVVFSLWALLFLFGALHQAMRGTSRWFTLTAAAAIGAAGWFEQTPWSNFVQTRVEIAAKLAADRTTVATLEHTVGAEARVFQLPFVPFPEAGVTVKLRDYEHLRPFLASAGLHFSYGMLRGREESDWCAATARLSAAAMIERLQATGFAALWIDRRGYADNAVALLTQLRALGLAEIPTARADDVTVFRLQPRSPALAPDRKDARVITLWNPQAVPAADQPWLLARTGWWPVELAPNRAWRWGKHEARVRLDWDQPGAVAGELRFIANSVADGQLTIRHETRVLGTVRLTGSQPREYTLPCPLEPGSHELTFEYDGRLRRYGRDQRQIGFMIENLICTPR